MKEQRRAARTVLGWFALAALTPLGLTFAWLPARLGLWVGARLGDLAWTALPRRRTVALENLARAFPGRSATDRLAAWASRLADPTMKLAKV